MEEKKWKVYVHTNKSNDKKYVGITSQKVEYRWNHGRAYKQSPYFNAAIQKYGWDGFTHEVLFEGLSLEEATQKEQELIAEWKTQDRNFGYNATAGGEGLQGYVPSDELRALWSKVRTGRKRPPETGQRISQALNNLSDEAKLERNRKISESKYKPVEMYDMDWNYIRTFKCVKDAAEFINQARSGGSHISDVCYGSRNHCGGYKWKFA